MPIRTDFSPAELCDLFDISKSTLLRWEREGVVPPTDRDISTQKNARLYTQEHVRAIVEKQRDQQSRQYTQIAEAAEHQLVSRRDGQSSAGRAQAKLQDLFEAHSLRKLIGGDELGLSELREYDRLSPETIQKLVRVALDHCNPADPVFSQILRVACEQSEKLRRA